MKALKICNGVVLACLLSACRDGVPPAPVETQPQAPALEASVEADLPESLAPEPVFQPYEGGATITEGGHCFLDVINGGATQGVKLRAEEPAFFGGWMADESAQVPKVAHLLLQGERVSYSVPLAAGGERPDVASILKNEGLKNSGFNLVARLDGVTAGNYRLAIVTGERDTALCNLGVVVAVED